MTGGAIILCGGRSARMGTDKAWLPFGPGEVMLQRVVRIMGTAIEPRRTVVVAAVGQKLPELPADVRIARDRCPERGPMEGLAAGLRVLENEVDAAFVTSCDVPLLRAAFVERLFGLLKKGDWLPAQLENTEDHSHAKVPVPFFQQAKPQAAIVVPRKNSFHHPLSAVYRMNVLPAVEKLLAADRLRLRFLFETCHTREVPVENLRDIDPSLDSLTNCNRPEDYAAALEQSGFDLP